MNPVDIAFDATAKVLAVVWLFIVFLSLAVCLAGAKQDGRITIRPMFAAFDCWMGVYWDSQKRVFYWFPLPMLGLKIFGAAAPDTPSEGGEK